ncbi:MAG: 5'/3'-nucleotidase SurE [Acidimicrobiales bacterium]
MDRPRILLTNDDGIDSVGLHTMARRLQELAEVVVVAPDYEYSGAGASIGALHTIQPQAHLVDLDGIETAYSVNGPPGLCVMFANLGAFGPRPDMIVSGINPGANVGRSIYHSGTVGACLTGRNYGIPGVAVSQGAAGFGFEGQAYEDMLANQIWDSAAQVALVAVEAMLTLPTDEPHLLNLNVPNLPIDQLAEWRWTEVARFPTRAMSKATLVPKTGHNRAFTVEMEWGDQLPQPEGTDTQAMVDEVISASWLGRIEAADRDTKAIDAAFDQFRADLAG